MPQPASLHDHRQRQRDRVQRAIQHAWPQASPADRTQLTVILAAVDAGELAATDAHRIVADFQRRQQARAA